MVISNSFFKKIIIGTSILFSLFIIIYNLETKVAGIDSIPIGIEAILILIFSFYYFYEQMKDVSTLFIYGRFHFWIVLGMMIYLAGSFFIYIYASQLETHEVAKYWIFTNIFSIIKSILFTIAIFINGSQSTKKNRQAYPAFTLN
jgi:voltage-gated potassium channel Kch